jgi:hypothetical protein
MTNELVSSKEYRNFERVPVKSQKDQPIFRDALL